MHSTSPSNAKVHRLKPKLEKWVVGVQICESFIGPQQYHTRPADQVMRCCSMIVLWKILSDTSLPDLIRRIFHLHLRLFFWESQLVYQISVTNRDFSNMPNQPDEVHRASRGLTFASTSHGHQLYVPWPVALKGIKGFFVEASESWWSLMINDGQGGPELKC